MDTTLLQQQIETLTKRIDALSRSSNIPRDVETALRERLGIGATGIVEAFPVNSIFTSISSTNPATTLGYGTWTSFASGRTLVGVDGAQTEFDTVEETGGEKVHTLTTGEMPSHTHDIIGSSSSSGGTLISSQRSNASGTVTGVIASSGGGESHNNLQPYITVYFWKRTA